MFPSRLQMMFKATTANAGSVTSLLGKLTPFVIPMTAAAIGGTFLTSNPTMMKTSPSPQDCRHIKDSELPLITMKELQQHTVVYSPWVTCKGIVYDISEFILGHPGGTDRLLMAAGMDLVPFFNIFTEHYRGHVLPFMQRFRIGCLNKRRCKDFEFTNPHANDPEWRPVLLHCTTHSFNAEPRIERLTEHYYTPNGSHYVRNKNCYR